MYEQQRNEAKNNIVAITEKELREEENEEEVQVMQMSLLGEMLTLLLLGWLIHMVITNRQSLAKQVEEMKILKRAREFFVDQWKKWLTRTRDKLVLNNTVLELDLEYVRITDRRQRILPVIGRSFLQPQRVLWYRSLVTTLESAAKDEKVKALIVRLGENSMDSAGLSVVEELRKAVFKFRSSGKVAIMHAETLGELSDGTKQFLFGTAFDAIMVDGKGLICTPGLSVSPVFVKNLLQKLNIEAEMFSRDQRYKTYPNMFTEDKMTPEHRAEMEKLLGGIMERITADIAQGRNVDVERVKQWFDTAMWFPSDAHNEGMIDFATENGRDDARMEVAKRLRIPEKAANYVFLDRYEQVVTKQERARDWKAKSEKKSKRPSVALVHLHGNVIRGEQTVGDITSEGGGSTGIYSENISRMIRAISAEGKTKVIVLRINSGGGSGTAAHIIGREIVRARNQGIKFYAQVGDMCASAAYMIAMHCDKIISNRSSITGSIGVVAGKFNFGNALDNVGIKFDTIKSHENSDLFHATKAMSEKQREILDNLLDRTYEQFVNDVAKYRKMTREQVEKVAGGRVFLGEEAKELGLVDEIGTLSETLDLVKKDLRLEEADRLDIKLMPKDTMPLFRLFDRPKNEDEKDKLFSRTSLPIVSSDAMQSVGHLVKLGNYAKRFNEMLRGSFNGTFVNHSTSLKPFNKPPTRSYGIMLLKAMRRV